MNTRVSALVFPAHVRPAPPRLGLRFKEVCTVTTAHQPMPAIEILLPDGWPGRAERRRAPNFRPYTALDGCAPQSAVVAADRRRRRRPTAIHDLGQLYDLES